MRLPLLSLLAAVTMTAASPCTSLNRYRDFSPTAEHTAALLALRTRGHAGDSARDAALHAELRKHLWRLFAALTLPLNDCPEEPIWRTWYSPGEVFSGKEPAAPTRVLQHLEFRKPRKLEAMLPTLELRGAVFSNVLFNRAALKHVQANRLQDRNVLNAMLKDGRRDIPEFPVESAVVKTLWRHVGDNPVKVGLWDVRLGNGAQIREQDWPACVSVVKTSPAPGTKAPCGTKGGQQLVGDVLPVTNFYRIEVTAQNKDSITALLRPGELGNVKVGDSLILLALHVTTKEIPDWVWATWWWQPGTADPLRGADGRRGVWKNYTGDITVSMVGPREAGPQGPLKNAMFNPYIEAANIRHGTSSNCMTCHSAASSNPDSLMLNAVEPNRVARTLEQFENKLRTDFIWGIGLRRTPQ